MTHEHKHPPPALTMASETIHAVTALGILIIFLCSFTLSFARASPISYEQQEDKRLSNNAVVVKGRVLCDTCPDHQFSETTTYTTPGALVAVECSIHTRKGKWRTTIVSVKGETDVNGEFRVEVPLMYNLNPKRQCSVRLLSSPDHSCSIPSITTSSQLTLTSSNSDEADVYTSSPLAYHPQWNSLCTSNQEERVFTSSLPRRKALEESTSASKATSSPPPLLSVPPLPKLSVPPLPNTPPLPKLGVPPLPNAPPLPMSSIPPLPKLSAPPLPSATPLPKVIVPPLPSATPLPKLSVPPLPQLGVPSLPNAPSFPKLAVPPLKTPNSPPVSIPNVPPLPKLTVPPLPPLTIPSPPPLPKLSVPPLPSFTFPIPPSSFKFPPLPFFTPPPPSTKDQTP